MNRFIITTAGIVHIIFVSCFGGQTDKTLSQSQTMNQTSGNSKSTEKKDEEKKTMATESTLPMGITDEMPLQKIQLVYGFYSAKTGAGRQELTILADGTITLFYSRSYNDQNPKLLEAKCDKDQVLRLLDFLEGMGFFGLPDEFSSNDHPHARRLLKFSMPGREKVVAVDEPGNYAIEQCIGAIKLCAGICIPEAINQRFFPNL